MYLYLVGWDQFLNLCNGNIRAGYTQQLGYPHLYEDDRQLAPDWRLGLVTWQNIVTWPIRKGGGGNAGQLSTRVYRREGGGGGGINDTHSHTLTLGQGGNFS